MTALISRRGALARNGPRCSSMGLVGCSGTLGRKNAFRLVNAKQASALRVSVVHKLILSRTASSPRRAVTTHSRSLSASSQGRSLLCHLDFHGKQPQQAGPANGAANGARTGGDGTSVLSADVPGRSASACDNHSECFLFKSSTNPSEANSINRKQSVRNNRNQ